MAHRSARRSCLQRLGLAYRVKLMATGDMGFTQAKKYDLEVWAPGRPGLARGQLGLELPRLPGSAHEHPLAARTRRASRRSCTRSTARAWRCRGRGGDPRGLSAAGRVCDSARTTRLARWTSHAAGVDVVRRRLTLPLTSASRTHWSQMISGCQACRARSRMVASTDLRHRSHR